MRRIITIIMLAAAVMVGSASVEAKSSSKKKSSSQTSSSRKSSSGKSTLTIYCEPEDELGELNLPVERVTISKSSPNVRVKLKGNSQEKSHRIDWIDDQSDALTIYFTNGGFVSISPYNEELVYSPTGIGMGIYEIDMKKSGLEAFIMDDDDDY